MKENDTFSIATPCSCGCGCHGQWCCRWYERVKEVVEVGVSVGLRRRDTCVMRKVVCDGMAVWYYSRYGTTIPYHTIVLLNSEIRIAEIGFGRTKLFPSETNAETVTNAVTNDIMPFFFFVSIVSKASTDTNTHTHTHTHTHKSVLAVKNKTRQSSSNKSQQQSKKKRNYSSLSSF